MAELDQIGAALTAMLRQHEPFPAVVLDRGWNVLRANEGAARLFGTLLAPEPIPQSANVLRLMIEPGPVRDAVLNWPRWRRRCSTGPGARPVGGVLDLATAELVSELRARPEVAAVLSAAEPPPSAPVLGVRFLFDATEFGFFSMVSTIGTPIDVTAQELRVEAFFPADEATRTGWT